MENRFIPGDLVSTSLGIAKILDTYHNGDYYFEGKNFTGQDDNIRPIPLTPAILLKNGWKGESLPNGRTWYSFKTKRAYLYMVEDTARKGEFLVCVGKSKHNLASVSFIHQLQHLLFGLGINSDMEV